MIPAFKLLAALSLALVTDCTHADASSPRTVLARLTVEEKASQVQMILIRAALANPQSLRARDEEALVRIGVGGVVVDGAAAGRLLETVNRLQELGPLPLLVASDLDWGVEANTANAITRLPALMAVGAAGSEVLAEQAGRISAREARALGVRLMLAPVLDVNTNPDNPIINVRSFGEDPQAVARLGSAFIRGARSEGVLATAKHFPGHGATAIDSHRALPIVPGDRARLESVELLPFRAAIAAGVDAVMVGHLAVPALDASGVPATASERIITGLLRGELEFRGLVLTDSMGMGAVTQALEPGEAAVRALAAGADMVAASPDPRRATAAIVQAVRSGRLSMARLDAAVVQILQAKAAMDLDRERLTPLQPGGTAMSDSDATFMQQLAERSITLLRDERHILPLSPGRPLLHIVVLAGLPPVAADTIAAAELHRRARDAEQAIVTVDTAAEIKERLVARGKVVNAVIVSIFLPITVAQGSSAIPGGLAQFVRSLVATGASVVIVSYSSPYLLRQFPQAPAYLCAYSSTPFAQRAAIKALFGESPIDGRLPVSLPSLYPLGHGLKLPAPGAASARAVSESLDDPGRGRIVQ